MEKTDRRYPGGLEGEAFKFDDLKQIAVFGLDRRFINVACIGDKAADAFLARGVMAERHVVFFRGDLHVNTFQDLRLIAVAMPVGLVARRWTLAKSGQPNAHPVRVFLGRNISKTM